MVEMAGVRKFGQKKILAEARIKWLGWEELNPHIRNQNPLYYHYTTAHLMKSYKYIKKWLGREDSNPRMHGPKPCVLPLDDGPTN